MDNAAIIALAVGILLVLFQYAFKDMPWWIVWPGIAICVAVIVWKLGFVQLGHTSIVPQVVMVLGAFALVLGALLYVGKKSDDADDKLSAMPSGGPAGAWEGSRFIFDSPQLVFTKALHPKDDGSFYRFPVPNMLPKSFVRFKVEYDGGLAKALVVPHENQVVGWESISRDTQAAVRIADDSTTVLKVHVPQNSDMTLVRVYALWWERPKPAQAPPPKAKAVETQPQVQVPKESSVAERNAARLEAYRSGRRAKEEKLLTAKGTLAPVDIATGTLTAGPYTLHATHGNGNGMYVSRNENVRAVRKVGDALGNENIDISAFPPSDIPQFIAIGECVILETMDGSVIQLLLVSSRAQINDDPENVGSFRYEIYPPGTTIVQALRSDQN